MYFGFSPLTWRPRQAAARSRVCSRDSAGAGIFAISAMSPVLPASVIIWVGYLLLLSFASLKPFSFIKSIDVLKTKSTQIIYRYEANVSPCSTSATMSK